ncbi:MAG: sugar transferase [Lutibacter sp.]|uniref:sugar transferase n=1 Tax=Lutibacter sp. TaxID=1925666 RepID=UPI001A0E8920|nr:sugar transferase [Lutibacter sp.]NOR28403.1 sugar transferase [Lutibacter sp.]
MIRFFDLLIAVTTLLLISPIVVVIILIMVVLQEFPVLFLQTRIGKNFKPFTIYKFRTMHSFTEDKQGLTKGFSDKRITNIGLFLRKYKLDELPQLYNVLKGDMSLVGSRPQVPYYTKKFEKLYTQILVKKPGVFSPAASKYSNEEELLDKVDNPTHYYETVLVPIKCEMDIQLVKNFTLKKYIEVLLGYVKKSVLKC